MVVGQRINVQPVIAFDSSPGLRARRGQVHSFNKSYAKVYERSGFWFHEARSWPVSLQRLDFSSNPYMETSASTPLRQTHVLIAVAPLVYQSRFSQRSRASRRYTVRDFLEGIGFHHRGASEAPQKPREHTFEWGRPKFSDMG